MSKEGGPVGDVVLFAEEIVASRLDLDGTALARRRLEDEYCVLGYKSAKSDMAMH